jgi:adenosylhomocysteine nucleosidase
MTLLGLLLAALLASPAMAQKLDTQPRTAIMTAFAPEKTAMMALLRDKKIHRLNGAEIVTGTLEDARSCWPKVGSAWSMPR